ncbi:MAG: hypothetical protein AAF601_02490 [Pseudomonadota bacterium]
MKRNGSSSKLGQQARRIEIDVAKYQAMLDDANLDEIGTEKALNAIWFFICGLVELGFEVSPVQQALNASSGVADALDYKKFKEKQKYKQEVATLEPRPAEGVHGKASTQKRCRYQTKSGNLLPRLVCSAEGRWLRPCNSGTSLPEYAESKGYDVAAVIPDDVTGGGEFMKRPGMVALLSFIDASRTTTSLLYSMTSSALRAIRSFTLSYGRNSIHEARGWNV